MLSHITLRRRGMTLGMVLVALAAITVRPAEAAWIEYQKLTAGGGAAHDSFGNSVSLDGTMALMGSFSADGGSKAGSAYVFGDFGGTWTQTAKLSAGVRVEGAEFGRSVSLDGTRALVGAPYDLKGTPIGIRAGSAYVFEHNGSSWSHVAKLTASDAGHQDAFGYAVSLSYSGTVALVGAYADKDEGWYARLGVRLLGILPRGMVADDQAHRQPPGDPRPVRQIRLARRHSGPRGGAG